MAEDEQTAVATKKGRKLLWILLGTACLVVLGVGAMLLMDYLRPPQVAASDGQSAGGKASAQAGEGGLVRVRSTMNLDPFLVNLADSDSTRFVKITFRLGLDKAGIGAELEKNSVVVAATRDKIISILTTKTSDQILTVEGKDALRDEVRTAVGPLIPDAKVIEVYIMDFVVQL